MASIKASTEMQGGPRLPGAPAVGRIAAIGPGAPGALMEEKFTAVDAAAKTFEFDTVLTNFKGFNPVIGWPNQIKLEKVASGTKVTWDIQPRMRATGLPF